MHYAAAITYNFIAYNGIFLQRQSISPPAIPCNSSNEGESLYKAVHADMIWICKSEEWTPYK